MSKSPSILPTHTPELFQKAVMEAVALLRAGELVALPTETVYGLAANALNPDAVQKIFQAKGRPPHNPIIVHVATLDMARECVCEWPGLAQRLGKAFWPGPLTLVLPRSSRIPDLVTAGGNTVGVRWPSHPVMQAVIQGCGFPLAAPSANRFAQLSPTLAGHVRRSLGDRISLILDGGPSQVGIESTVLDLSVSPPKLLRPGMIPFDSLLAVTGKLAQSGDNPVGVLKSPGLLTKHYAPQAKLVVLSWTDDADLKAKLAQLPGPSSGIHILAHTHLPSPQGYDRLIVMPHTPAAFARALYGELHRCDEAGARWIIVEALPEGPNWRALADRLKRAAA